MEHVERSVGSGAWLRRGGAWAWGLLLAALPLAAQASPASHQPPPGWIWEVSADAALRQLDVRMRFRAFDPRRLLLPVADASDAVRPAEAGTVRLEAQEGGFAVRGSLPPEGGTISYSVDVATLLRRGYATRVGGDLLTQPGAWMLVPARFTPEHGAEVLLQLPAGLSASVPWPESGSGLRRVADTAFLFESRVAFGRFTERRLHVGGAAFDVCVLDAPRRASDAGLDRWLGAAGACVAALYDERFPVPRVQVIVEPVGPAREPVVFGRAMQAGGEAVLLYLAGDAADADLPWEWIAVHELTHLGLPWIVTEDAWLSEGFVTWYQETLRGRAGYYGEEGAWRALEEGFARGRRSTSDRPLAEESRLMAQRHAYMRVYWAGAALAMRIDLALRAESGGRTSLDDVMRLWNRPEIRARRGWRGLELLAEADRRLGSRVCEASARAFLPRAEFPPTEDLFASLGIGRGEDGARTYSPDAAARALRRAVGGGAR